MSDARPAALEAILVRFGELFDARQYWDAHEVLEGWWQHHRDDLWQALIQLAAAFVHIDAGRLPGAARVLARAVARLDTVPERAHGLDVTSIAERSRRLLAHLRRADAFDEAQRFELSPLLGAGLNDD